MAQFNDLSRSFTAFDQDSTLLCAVEMSAKSWLVAALVPGVPRQPLKKMEACEGKLLAAIASWREEAEKAGRPVKRVVVAYEAGRDGFWLARLLKAHGIEAYVIHPSSIPVSREHKRAKTDRLDAAMLLRALLGWLRGERKHCQMAEIPSAEAEDERRLGRERERLVGERTRIVNRIKSLLAVLGVRGFNPKLKKAAEKLAALRTADGLPVPTNARAQILRLLQRLSLVRSQIAEIESERLERLEANKEDRANRMVALLARIVGTGIETADLIVREALNRSFRDRRALARYAGLTGAPDQSGAHSREQGLAKSGNARLRRGLIELAWRFLKFQPNAALTRWYKERTQGGKRKTTMIVAMARRLLIDLDRFVKHGAVPEGVVLRKAA